MASLYVWNIPMWEGRDTFFTLEDAITSIQTYASTSQLTISRFGGSEVVHIYPIRLLSSSLATYIHTLNPSAKFAIVSDAYDHISPYDSPVVEASTAINSLLYYCENTNTLVQIVTDHYPLPLDEEDEGFVDEM